MGGSSKGGYRLQLIDARGVVKNILNRKRYLFIVRQAFLNTNSEETLLAEDQIECYGVKAQSLPRVFGGKKLINARDQVGIPVKLGIIWDGFTRYLYVSPLTR